MGDELRQKVKLEDVVRPAAEAAFLKARIGVPKNHEIYTDLKQLVEGKKVIVIENRKEKEKQWGAIGAFTSLDVLDKRKATTFITKFKEELKRRGVDPIEFGKVFELKVEGTELVFTRISAPSVKIPSTKGMELSKAMETALIAGARATGIDVSTDEWQQELKTFMDLYNDYLVKREDKDRHGGIVYAFLKNKDMRLVKAFTNAFFDKIKESGRKLEDFGLKGPADPTKEFDKYVVYLNIVPLRPKMLQAG